MSISIIIPTYNSGETLVETVETALAQKSEDVEVIVVDDGSTDGTRETLEQNIDDRRFKYIQQPHQGVSVARNTGLELSSGKFICFLDSDDLLEPVFAFEMINLLARTRRRVAYCNYRYFEDGPERRTLGIHYPTFEGDVIGRIISEHFIPTCTVLAERAAIGALRFSPSMQAAEDWLFWILLLKDHAIAFHPRTMAHIRVRPGSLGRRKEAMARGVVSAMQEVDRAVIPFISARLEQDDLARYRYRFASALFEVRDFRAAFDQWIQATKQGLPARQHLLLLAKAGLESLGLRRRVEGIIWDYRMAAQRIDDRQSELKKP